MEHPELIVEFLVPERGRASAKPYPLPKLGLNAQALRFLEFLAQDTISTNVEWVSVNLPHPAYFALHKLVVLSRRTGQAKQAKDQDAALKVLEALIKKGEDIVLPMSDAALAGKTIAADQISDIFGIDMANNSDADPKHIMPGKTENSPRRISIDIKTTSGKKIAPSAKKELNAKTITAIHKPSPIADKPKMHFTGKLVTTMRQRLKLTVPQFAKRVTVSPAIVYQWGKTPGDLKLRNRTMRKLAELHQQLMPPK
jgi:DNA-binding transcriptional regulator YiaG